MDLFVSFEVLLACDVEENRQSFVVVYTANVPIVDSTDTYFRARYELTMVALWLDWGTLTDCSTHLEVIESCEAFHTCKEAHLQVTALIRFKEFLETLLEDRVTE